MFRPSLLDGRRSNDEWRVKNVLTPRFFASALLGYTLPTSTRAGARQAAWQPHALRTSAIVLLPTGRRSFVGTLSQHSERPYVPLDLDSHTLRKDSLNSTELHGLPGSL